MKTQYVFIIFISVFLLMNSLSGCNTGHTQKYRGISVDDINGTEGLRNPDRGFRLEVALDVESLKNVFGSPVEGVTGLLEKEAQKYASDSITLVQTYFYLTQTVGRPLSEKNFAAMQTFFDKLRELGMKAVLRFAYETEFLGRAKTGPTMEDVRMHTSQLKPFLEKNKDVIHVVQAGFIGAWGEWHGSFHGLEKTDDSKREVLNMILDMTPKDRNLQIRVPGYKNLLGKEHPDYNRVSFHDDFIVIKTHVWDGGMSEGTPSYEQIVKESPYLVVDGELPWGSWSMNRDPDDPDGGWLIDGEQTARRLFLQHYTSLSAIHNYKEGNTSDKYSMMYWKEMPVSIDFLKQEKMPVSDSYFQKRDGTPIDRNVFDYIRDHLGYRIELQSLSTNKRWVKGENPIDLSLINRGFSTLYNEHKVGFVLLDQEGNVCVETFTDINVNDWQPYGPNDENRIPLVHNIKTTIILPESLPKGNYRLALWIPDGSEQLMYDPKFAIRCANGNTLWLITPDGKYGVNILLEDITIS